MKNQENDLDEIGKVLIFAIVVTWIPFAFFEIHQPFVEKQERYRTECEAKGGFVYDQQNEVKKCIKKDYITIPINM